MGVLNSGGMGVLKMTNVVLSLVTFRCGQMGHTDEGPQLPTLLTPSNSEGLLVTSDLLQGEATQL